MRPIKRLYRNLKWFIAPYLNPRQKWLTKQIPRVWTDKCDLVPICLFTILIDFVENEDHNLHYDYKDASAEGVINDEWVTERIEIHQEILAAYDYITKERPALAQELGGAYPDVIHITVQDGQVQTDWSKYRELYKEVHRLEKIIENKDTWAMNIIVKHRNYLWT